MAAKIDFLFQNGRSRNWYCRFQYPRELWDQYGKVREFSTGTPDYIEAKRRILDAVREHQERILTVQAKRRPPVFKITGRMYTDGSTTLEDGTIRIVVGDTVHVIRDGKHSTMPNLPFLGATRDYDPENPPPAPPGVVLVGKTGHTPRRAPAPRKPADDGEDTRMLETFLEYLPKGNPRNPYYNREARNEWAAFRAFVGGKPMWNCTRQDGRNYAEHLFKTGLKTATVVKRINYLSAPIAHDASFTDMRPNPFDRAIVEREDDAKEILPFTDEDMELLNLKMVPNLNPNEKLLWLICATTGMRHSEAFQIDQEHTHLGIRYVKVGQKTKTSKRDVPLPDCLLPHLRGRITGPLFTDSCKNVSKNLLRALRRAGITDPQKNVYSLRHRAHARLRRMRCPGDLQRLIVGHTLEHKVVRKDDHYAYGKDCLVDLTKPWIDQIGY